MTSRAAFKHSYIKQSKDVYSWRRVMWKNTQVHFKTKHNGLASLIRLWLGLELFTVYNKQNIWRTINQDSQIVSPYTACMWTSMNSSLQQTVYKSLHIRCSPKSTGSNAVLRRGVIVGAVSILVPRVASIQPHCQVQAVLRQFSLGDIH